ncbi:MAG: BamA/TamA family outer membrane protein [Balneolaceae bacterium]
MILLFSYPVHGLIAQNSDTRADTTSADADNERIGTSIAFVPALGFNSNSGVSVGGLAQRFDYGDGTTKPFDNFTKVRSLISTKGRFIFKIDFDITKSFGTDIRSQFFFEALKFDEMVFAGIGNNTPFNRTEFDNDIFFFDERRIQLQYFARKRFTQLGQRGFVDLFLSSQVAFSSPRSLFDETILFQQQPNGIDGGWINWFGLGFIIDSRNSEFNPTRGFFIQTEASLSDNIFGSDYDFGLFKSDVRHFLQVIPNLVLAQRLRVEHVTGNAPFWELASLGSDESLRGFIEDRFRGDTSILNITELRTWLFETKVFGVDLDIGFQTFYDTGRVFTADDANALFKNWKKTYGAGVAFSAFSPDFIARIEIGHSDEISRIYFSTSYAF